MLLGMRNLKAAWVLLVASLCHAQTSSQWQKLIEARKYKQAEVLCSSLSRSTELGKRIEAEKCLANVELCKGSQINLTGNDTGGGSIGSGYSPETVRAALVHLNRGIELAPQDASLHQGRLHVLESAGMFHAMNQAVDESATIYKGTDALKMWLAYDYELGDMGEAKAGLEFAEVLDRHFPNSHDVLGNIGAFHNMLKEHTQALPFLKRALDLAPNDPIDAWNLGWTFNSLDQIEEADKWMSKALALDPEGTQTPGSGCLYAEFVETKLHQKERACALEKVGCEESRQTACVATPGKPSSSLELSKQPVPPASASWP
jgi:tetratricopeptide (TPR) repeat protein